MLWQHLEDCYEAIAELWCNPKESNHLYYRQKLKEHLSALKVLKEKKLQEALNHVQAFLSMLVIKEEEYIELFELSPQCALYLGSFYYEEPKTCAKAAVSERNHYMIDLNGIYRHFGLQLSGKELPDYLPVMIDFLRLTLKKRNDPIRKKSIKEYFLPYLPAMKERLEGLHRGYFALLCALECLLEWELTNLTDKSHVG